MGGCSIAVNPHSAPTNNIMQPHSLSQHRGFTLIELLVTVAIISVTAVLIAPTLQSDDHFRLLAASSIMRSDIELAQVMTISTPQDPIVVRFDTANNQYWLALASSPDIPIIREDTEEPYLITIGQGRAVSALGVSFTTLDLKSDTLEFNPQGGLVDFASSPSIIFTSTERWIQVDITPTTGRMTETAGSG